MLKKLLSKLIFIVLWTLITSISHMALSQQVGNRRCPELYKRNNGNGQKVTEYASNISPASIYFLSALSKSNQGNFTFGWAEPIIFPPVVTKSWITTTDGNTYLDWEFGNNESGSPFNPPGIPNGNEVKYTFYNNNLPTAGLITLELTDPIDGLPYCTCTYPLTSGSSAEVKLVSEENLRVSSGNDGGLESRSLGTAVVEQVFERFSSGKNTLNYKEKETLKNYRKAKVNGFELSSLIPDEQMLGENFVGYLTSPEELLAITNAEEVVSVDFLNQGNNLATFFATKTSEKVYEHSKYVCDRLKGAEILAIDSIQIGEFNLIRSLLKPTSGLNEYSISFSIGITPASNEMHLQSAWLLEDYVSEPSFYNFQFWSADGKLLQLMIENILSQVKNFGSLHQTVSKTTPGIFVSKTHRITNDPSKVSLKIWNRTLETSATIQLTSKPNENSQTMITSTMEVELTPMGTSSVEIDAKDYSEVSISLIDKSIKNDYLYQSDGIWAHYIPTGGSIIQNQISNTDNFEVLDGDYPILRNVAFSASGSDYATVYKTIKGGAVPEDLSEFNFLNFKASGQGEMTIRFVKKSVENFDAHYYYTFDLSKEIKSYSIPLSNFRSNEFSENVKLDDLVILSFTSQNQGLIAMNLSEIRFSNRNENQKNSVLSIKAYPNPFQEKTNIQFESKFGGQMQLGVYNLDGNLVASDLIETKAGQNQRILELNRVTKKGIYILKISSNLELLTSKLIIN
ncbi:T9SS type A sorting domain-containing protein [Algoriphagus winogradskyi]|uniref:Por secretion system C-terminal sorting domain-containing protein n=1 Tax=Algoriphagus winogradskyi TaxID=237017 RepID=A0ABY1NI83_9BACT|nr:T9SS type A sorting domain-containing protein [Algoriphagus winogradskyi]SMP08293.1 Por secretion system C-terminal sorting domain-containing protein [Algoriphagus winogradskyi]